MSHGLDTIKGNASFMGSIEGAGKEWHGLSLTLDDARARALDITMNKVEVTANGHPIDGQYAVVPSNTGIPLSNCVVGRDWTPYQWGDRLELADSLCAALPGAKIESICSIWGGADTAISIRLAMQMGTDKDPLHPYLSLLGNNTGRRGEIGKLNSLRVVCHNTRTIALGENTPHHTVYHFKSVADRMRAVSALAASVYPRLESDAATIQRLMAKPITVTLRSLYHDRVLPYPDAPKVTGNREQDEAAAATYERQRVRVSNIRKCWIDNEEEERQTLAYDPNLWCAYNSITKWSQHQWSPRKSEASQSDSDRRFYSNAFGNGFEIDMKAQAEALSLLNA